MSRAGAILKARLKLRVLTFFFGDQHRFGLNWRLRTAFWPKSGRSVLDRALSVGWISKKKRSPPFSCRCRLVSLPTTRRRRWPFLFFFWRSTPPSGRDLTLSVPTLAKKLFWGINQTNDQDVLHLFLLYLNDHLAPPNMLPRTPKGCEHPWLGTPGLDESWRFLILWLVISIDVIQKEGEYASLRKTISLQLNTTFPRVEFNKKSSIF